MNAEKPTLIQWLKDRCDFSGVEWAIIAAIIVLLATLALPPIFYAQRFGASHITTDGESVTRIKTAPMSASRLITVTHDEHRFVVDASLRHFLHHPDCPCKETP